MAAADGPPALVSAPAFVFPRRLSSPSPPPRADLRPQTQGPQGGGARPSAATVWFRVPGHYLEKCGLCGLPLDMLRLIAPQAHQAQDVVVCHDATSAQFYHLGCTTGAVFDPDVRVVTLRLAPADALHRCANDACARTLPREAPRGYTPPVGSAEAPRRWDMCVPRGEAVVEVTPQGGVFVYHPACFGEAPRLVFTGAADAAAARVSIGPFVRAEWFGSSERTSVHVVGAGAAFAHDAAGHAYPTHLAIEESLERAWDVPPRHARAMRPADVRARAIPWSFECFVRQAFASPAHTVSEVSLPAALVVHSHAPGSGAVVAPLPAGRDARAAPDQARFVIRHGAHPPTLDAWLAYVRDVVAARDTRPVHPLHAATLDAVRDHLGVDLAALPRGVPHRISHGLDAFVCAPPRTRAFVYLTSGVYDARAGPAPRPAWVPLDAVTQYK